SNPPPATPHPPPRRPRARRPRPAAPRAPGRAPPRPPPPRPRGAAPPPRPPRRPRRPGCRPRGAAPRAPPRRRAGCASRRRAVEEPALRGLPLCVHLMDFWWICPNYLLWRRDGTLCDGPPEGGAGCIWCLDERLDTAIAERRAEQAVRAVGWLPTPPGNQGPS